MRAPEPSIHEVESLLRRYRRLDETKRQNLRLFLLAVENMTAVQTAETLAVLIEKLTAKTEAIQ